MKNVSEFLYNILLSFSERENYELLRYVRHYSWHMNLEGDITIRFVNEGEEFLLPSSLNNDVKRTKTFLRILDDYFTQVKDTPDRFNRFVFELYADGTYKAEYLWDEEYIIQQRLRDAKNMPDWFLGRLTQRMEYWGYGDNWQTGQITVSVKGNKVFCEAYIIENGQKITITQDIVKEFENYVFESSILEDYEMTNFGILKDVWNRGNWNKMIIHCPEKEPTSGIRFLDPDKDVEYIWEE